MGGGEPCRGEASWYPERAQVPWGHRLSETGGSPLVGRHVAGVLAAPGKHACLWGMPPAIGETERAASRRDGASGPGDWTGRCCWQRMSPSGPLPAEAWLNTAQGMVGAARGLGGSRSSGPALRPPGWLKAVTSEDTRDPPCANRCSMRCRVGTREPQQADTHDPPCSRTRGAGRPTPRPHRGVHVLLAILWHLHDGAHDGARGQQGTPRPEDARRGVRHLRGWGEGTQQLGHML